MLTANLEMLQDLEIPEFGVYAARVYLREQEFLGITNVGQRSTVDNDPDISIETHILSFNQDIYGEQLELQLYIRLRQLKKFDNMSLLLQQLRFDCAWKLVVPESKGIKDWVAFVDFRVTA